MSDYAGRLNTLRVMLLVSACAMPLLFLFRENVALFYALLVLVYYCYGTQLSVYASTSADFYGTKNVGFNYGLLLLAWGVGRHPRTVSRRPRLRRDRRVPLGVLHRRGDVDRRARDAVRRRGTRTRRRAPSGPAH